MFTLCRAPSLTVLSFPSMPAPRVGSQASQSTQSHFVAFQDVPSAPSTARHTEQDGVRRGPHLPTVPPPRGLRLWAVPGGALVLGDWGSPGLLLFD